MPGLPVPPVPVPGSRLATPKRGSIETSVWRVEVAPDHPPTPHQLTREAVCIVLAGRARVRLGEDVKEASMGDAIVGPRGRLFEISVVGAEPLPALCCLPAGGEARLRSDGTTSVPPWAQ